jgi:hypothetical protein
MPGGYAIASVKVGSMDVPEIAVDKTDVTGVVINVAAPKNLPHLRGKVSGLPPDRLSSTKVDLIGPIIGSVQTSIRADGTFEFGALTPGMYRLRLPEVPGFAPLNVVVTWTDAEVQVAVPAR